MDRRIHAMWPLALIAAALLCTGCVDDARSPSPAAPETVSQAATSSASALLIPLDSNDRGHLERVKIEGSRMPDGSRKADLSIRDAKGKNDDFVVVKVTDSVRGLATFLTVHMWYGPHTEYAVHGRPRSTLSEFVATAPSRWYANDADVAYHFEDGYFVLDSVNVRLTSIDRPAASVEPTP